MGSVSARVALAASVMATSTACTAGDEGPSDRGAPASPAASASATPSPAQVVLALGEPATVTVTNRDGERSTVRVAVTDVTEGRIRHLRQFRLDEELRSSTPYYVTVRMRNTGAADLGGKRIVLWGLDSDGTVQPVADVVGSFRRCPNAPLPPRFARGDTASTCLLYLVPEGATLESVQYRFSHRSPFSWPVDG